MKVGEYCQTVGVYNIASVHKKIINNDAGMGEVVNYWIDFIMINEY